MIPRKHLKQMGFIEITDNLFMKKKQNGVKLYRDYRKDKPISYGYFNDSCIDAGNFKEFYAIGRIEQLMSMKQRSVPA